MPARRKRRKKTIVEEVNEKILSPEEREYLKLRAAGVDKKEAYRLAFHVKEDEVSDSAVRMRANRLEKRPDIVAEMQRIKDELNQRIFQEAPDAFERIVELSKFAKSEKVRLEANRDILSRAGFHEPVKLQSLAIFNIMSPDQIKNMLRENMLKAVKKLMDQDQVIDVEVKD